MKPIIAIMSRESQSELRGLQIANNLDAKHLFFNSENDVVENNNLILEASIVFVPVSDLKKESEMSARVQAIKFGAPQAWIVVLGDKKLTPEGAIFLKKSGANIVVSEEDMIQSLQPEFITSQKVHGQWLPIKAAELAANKVVPFALYHFMPLNRKFILFAGAQTLLDQHKIEKAMKVGEVYFHREDLELFQSYIKTNEDKSASGLVARCRHEYMSASILYKQLTLHLIDQSEGASFQAGKELLDRCYQLADNFVMTLGAVGDSWAIVNNSGFDDLTPIDRAPAIGATAALLSLLLNIGNPTQIFLSALLADLGLLDLPPRCLTLLRSGQPEMLPEEDLEIYKRHPILSIKRLLDRKIPLDDKTKQIILATHERVDGKGYPNQLLGDKIPLESQIIQVAEKMDNLLKVQWGHQRINPLQLRKELIYQLKTKQEVSIELLLKIEQVLPT